MEIEKDYLLQDLRRSLDLLLKRSAILPNKDWSPYFYGLFSFFHQFLLQRYKE
ncbi:hypothetical protein [Riemerella anatipestifer]|uniref:Uncharacterized protein n=1 Tax=Riemerella anatipestifer RA-CH-1 TaxID=1228997 RepID=J9R5H1_RIEAN|nr:hypothetical protein [Riemerella anatipestifer]AFR35683.1 hypothetical protein B739_1084 [Riemerella anatipestifer RA-CH-1]MCO7332851.1 hypothetical protein [Riemerella anatipestifer]MCO7351742.1 hypothetical protein [Riemerella anatipestifer]MCU7583571.1 hypothetical protein [Riemerella anatipestifer]MCW0487019.1 hypothetical protein [Riemerella anatipestifer]